MKIFIFPVESQGQKQIGIRTEQFDPACNALIKKIPRSHWNPGIKIWCIPYEKAAWSRCQESLATCQSKIPKNWSLEDFNMWLRREIEKTKCSEAYQDTIINALKSYFDKIRIEARTFWEIRPRKTSKLPIPYAKPPGYS